MQTKRDFARIGVFIGLAMIFSYIEFLIPIPLPFPGLKLGLANLVILIPLYLWGFKVALGISLLRIVLVGITFGNPAMMIYSLVGGGISLIIMALAKKIGLISPLGVSILGGVFHNCGQLMVAIIMVKSTKIGLYFPVLLAAGGMAGFVIGILAIQVLKRLGMEEGNGKKANPRKN